MMVEVRQIDIEELILLARRPDQQPKPQIEKHETLDENGARVFGVIASDGIKTRDGAG